MLAHSHIARGFDDLITVLEYISSKESALVHGSVDRFARLRAWGVVGSEGWAGSG